MNKRTTILNKYNCSCAYCGCPITSKSMEIDHMIPKRRGGTEDIGNLMPACRPCNRWKGAYLIEEFRIEIQKQVPRIRCNSGGFRMAERYGLVAEILVSVKFYFEESIDV